MIIDDQNLSNVERLHYLCSVLSGEASQAVAHLPVTDANFDVAWKLISTRYENKRRLINTHLQALFSLPQIASENSRNLQTLHDQTNTSIQALKNLGRPVDSWDDVLVYLVAQKLDKTSRKAWELKLSDTVEPSAYSDISKFLESRIRALDAILPTKPGGSVDTNIKSPKSKTIASNSATSSKFVCPTCKKNHLLYQCIVFQADTPARRHDFIKAQKRCFNCLAATYLTKDCKSENRCRKCSQKHHTLLHLSNDTKSPCDEPITASATTTNKESEIKSNTITSNVSSPKTNVLLATARVRVYSPHGRFARARALLDQGFAATLISENLAQILRLSRMRQNICVTGIGDAQSYARHTACVIVSPVNKNEPAHSTNAIILNSLTKYAPNKLSPKISWAHIADLDLADDDPMSTDPIDIIIGADLYGLMILDGIRKGRSNEPLAQNTILGWILSGPTSTSPSPVSIYSHHSSTLDILDLNLRRFWEVEDLPKTKSLTNEEQQCEDHFVATHARDLHGRYIIRLPFKSNFPGNFGDSRTAVLASLRRLERNLQLNTMKASAYHDFLTEYKILGHMEIVSKSQANPSTARYYIPHHAVFRESSTTSRLRVVFNASSKTSTGESLNDYLLAGPKLQTDLASVMLKWRQFRYDFTADIAKMYRQILVDSRDSSYQLILWRSSPLDPDEEYRLLTITYGTTSAPFFALRVLRQLDLDEGSQFPLALPVLQSQIYVDDCLFGADDRVLARQTRDQLIALLAKGCFRLRKWANNCTDLLTDLDPSDHGLACSKELRPDESLKVLGVSWNPDQDFFHFNVSITTEPGRTKRTILSFIAKFFDPLGWITPVIITAKILLQQLWLLKCDWDDVIPTPLFSQWADFYEQLPKLELLNIPRWTKYGHDVNFAELHGFSDASTRAYAAAVYLRIVPLEGPPVISLLVAKSKVAPLKTLSVPRLELCAALLLTLLTPNTICSHDSRTSSFKMLLLDRFYHYARVVKPIVFAMENFRRESRRENSKFTRRGHLEACLLTR